LNIETGNNNETDKALGLWTQAQEENELPSNEFLSTLGKHLQAHNMEVPFIMPAVEPVAPAAPKMQRTRAKETFTPRTRRAPTAPVQEKVSGDVDLLELKQSLRKNDNDKALEIKER